MILGFGNGNFHRLHANSNERFSEATLNLMRKSGASAIELSMRHSSMLDYFISEIPDLTGFDYISLHSPDIPFQEDKNSN